jgi:RNA polymerase sigma-19 factor, ECF subfamily
VKRSVAKQKTDLVQLAFERYRGGLQRFLMRRLDHAQNAQDLAQEVYLRLLRVDSADLVRQPQAYMYRIAAHVVHEFRLREEREKECMTIDSDVLADIAERVEDASVEEPWRRANTERELTRLLRQLPPVERAIIVMQKRDGLSYEEVAEKLDLSVHTVKKYLFRALLRLRQTGWNR